ncbi:spore coat U domain-containing protein [Phyllobacterium sp. OV277]|uniref:Csu type fimbrial protein n=1 Tax=Phyllobacterium sp. OV277 TaxID=1882772 RepID=UPI000885AE36|nr:spore coat U domain-containing protein [Phyllobacterium sp. OV277]SDP80071.1 Spore coat protein U (SCPU) domain-containing protein [Phyllobacterium sp. OV277]
MSRTKIIISILTAAAIGWSGPAYADPKPKSKQSFLGKFINGYEIEKKGGAKAGSGPSIDKPTPNADKKIDIEDEWGLIRAYDDGPILLDHPDEDTTSHAGSVDIKLTITNDCIVNNADSTKVGNAMLDFGSRMSVTKLIETNTSTNVSAIQITCTRGTAFNIALGKGLYHDGTSRRMGGGTGSYISYDLYRSASDTVPWGTTKGTDTLAVTTVKDDEPQPLTIYGRVPASTTKPAPGVYKDTVAISVVF